MGAIPTAGASDTKSVSLFKLTKGNTVLPQTKYITEALEILTPSSARWKAGQGLNEADQLKVIALLEDALSEDSEA